MCTFVTENITAVPTVMLVETENSVIRNTAQKNRIQSMRKETGRSTLRIKAPKSVPHAVHFETASSGTYTQRGLG